MAELYSVDITRITRHFSDILNDNELDSISNVRKTHFPNSDKPVNIYNLDMILAVGYRVKWLNYMNKVVLLLPNIYQIYFQKTNYAKMKCVGNSDILQTTKNI